MITFLEYSYNLEQVCQAFKKMASGNDFDEQMKWITTFVPVDFMSRLPEEARANAAFVFNRILNEIDKGKWDGLGKYIKFIWDQSIKGKTLGQELLNKMSVKVMENTNSEFFISYSGNLSKGGIYHYTKKNCRVFVNDNNYEWSPYQKTWTIITGDYTEHFNNYRRKQN